MALRHFWARHRFFHVCQPQEGSPGARGEPRWPPFVPLADLRLCVCYFFGGGRVNFMCASCVCMCGGLVALALLIQASDWSIRVCLAGLGSLFCCYSFWSMGESDRVGSQNRELSKPRSEQQNGKPTNWEATNLESPSPRRFAAVVLGQGIWGWLEKGLAWVSVSPRNWKLQHGAHGAQCERDRESLSFPSKRDSPE